MGAMFFAVLTVAAQLDRNYIREKTLEGHAVAANKGNHGGRPKVIDDDMLLFARALKDKGVPVPEIAKKLTIRTGKNAGQHPFRAGTGETTSWRRCWCRPGRKGRARDPDAAAPYEAAPYEGAGRARPRLSSPPFGRWPESGQDEEAATGDARIRKRCALETPRGSLCRYHHRPTHQDPVHRSRTERMADDGEGIGRTQVNGAREAGREPGRHRAACAVRRHGHQVDGVGPREHQRDQARVGAVEPAYFDPASPGRDAARDVVPGIGVQADTQRGPAQLLIDSCDEAG
ncbi:hypothetical protein GCM10023195_86710 [Actinoallomurus liliacearum]|uniref:Resolvase/invertase-type recombinase catalytic domain-containing protein n=1 Tax=Actinoallomurus liliacearum TaxID=1080073 RepID=A0ABP8U1K8_9ACTN